MALGTLTVIIAVALLLGPAGLGSDEPTAEAFFLSEVKKLLASDGQAGDLFGGSVAVSGDTAIVGGTSDGANAGAAYVFGRDEGGAKNWGEATKLTASDAQANDVFGIGVAVSGDTAFVGASAEDAGGVDAGAVYVFEQPVPTPTPTPTNTPIPTPTQTATPVPPTPIGGIGIFPGGDGAGAGAVSLPQTGTGGDRGAAVLNWLVAVAAGALALGGAAWYARRRLR